jgi:hypothetical protein
MKTWKHCNFWGIFAILAVIVALVACDPDNGSTHSHEFGTVWKSDATQHWHECSCGEKSGIANHTFENNICNICGYERIVSHTHSFGSNWMTSETQHWHECNCGEKSDVANHIWEWLVTTPGLETEICTICGKTKGTWMTKKIIVPEIPFIGGTSINFNQTLSGWDSNFLSTDVNYTISVNDSTLSSSTTNILASSYTPGSYITVTQTFYYKDNPIVGGSRTVVVEVGSGMFADMHTTIPPPYISVNIPEIILTLIKQVQL